MDNELTNLLPEDRRRALTRAYSLRLVVVIALMFSALVGAAALLLLPSYVFLVQNQSAKEARLATMEATTSSADEKTLSARLEALSKDSQALVALGKVPSASVAIRQVLELSRPGILLSGFTYTKSADGKSRTLVISGVAATRDALRKYQVAIQSSSFARSAELPVSAYAKDANISFAITTLLTP